MKVHLFTSEPQRLDGGREAERNQAHRQCTIFLFQHYLSKLYKKNDFLDVNKPVHTAHSCECVNLTEAPTE